MKDLETTLNTISESEPFKTGWYIKDLKANKIYTRFGDDVFPSASTRKTSIMMAALAAVHRKELDLREECILEERLQDDVKSGTLQFMTPGTKLPFRDVLVNMMITSDNVSTQMVLERISLEQMNEYCRSLGMEKTSHTIKFPPSNLPYDHDLYAVTTTSPADQGLLLDLIVKGARDEAAAAKLGSTPELCRFALDVLTWQRLTKIIAAHLPTGTVVGNKTGTGKRGRMDMGIVYRNEEPLFIMTYYTDQVPIDMPNGLPGHAAANQLGARLARACWDAIA